MEIGQVVFFQRQGMRKARMGTVVGISDVQVKTAHGYSYEVSVKVLQGTEKNREYTLFEWEIDKEYNGYTNYSTWNVALWLDNEYSYYCEVERLCKRTNDVETFTRRLRKWAISNRIQTDITYTELQSRVNWKEVGELEYQGFKETENYEKSH